MKEFNLEEFKKNPSQKVVTRDGREVRIICTDCKSDFSIVALIKKEQEESVFTYYNDGKFNVFGDPSPLDLFFFTAKQKGWVNVYRGKNDTRTLGCLFSSKEEAVKHKIKECVSSYIKTIKIEWEE